MAGIDTANAGCSMSITITIPGTPDRSLSPNSRCHWRVKAKHVKAYRHTSYLASLAMAGTTIRGPVWLDLEYGWEKGRRVVDYDNAISLAKSAIDGLVDAKVMGDDRYVVGLTVKQLKDPDKVGYLKVTVRAG